MEAKKRVKNSAGRQDICVRTYVCVYMCMSMKIFTYTYIYIYMIYVCIEREREEQKPVWRSYGVALVSRIDKIIGLFCKRAL